MRAEECWFRGESAVRLVSGPLAAIFTPDLGMTGVSLRHRGAEHLALPGGLDALRAGHTTGLPLLAPWANRLSRWRYRAAGVRVDLDGLPLHVDGNGLPIHGFLVGRPGWAVDRLDTRGVTARVRASLDVDAPAFPFPHRLEVTAVASETQLRVDTTVVPTGRRSVPVAFGWHPYLRLPGPARSRWWLRLPTRRHLALDALGIPTGESQRQSAEADPIGRRTFDDGYGLGRDRRLAIANDAGRSIELRCATAYPFAQVWVPSGRRFVALEPMVAPTNALVDRITPVVTPGDSFTASFTLTLDRSD
ncbi:MAG: aldose 1-epimerase [Acidimicrobiia bacterium]